MVRIDDPIGWLYYESIKNCGRNNIYCWFWDFLHDVYDDRALVLKLLNLQFYLFHFSWMLPLYKSTLTSCIFKAGVCLQCLWTNENVLEDVYMKIYPSVSVSFNILLERHRVFYGFEAGFVLLKCTLDKWNMIDSLGC